MKNTPFCSKNDENYQMFERLMLIAHDAEKFSFVDILVHLLTKQLFYDWIRKEKVLRYNPINSKYSMILENVLIS